MKDISQYGGDSGSNEIREPNKIIIFDNKIGKNCIKNIIKNCE